MRRWEAIGLPRMARLKESSAAASYGSPYPVGDVGDLRQPEAVRSIGREPAVDQVRRRKGLGMANAWCAVPCAG